MRAMGRNRKAMRYQVVFTAKPAGGPGLCERRFWILAFGVVLISVFTRLFDFSLVPLSYNVLFVTRPYCGLHSWENAHRAWAARCHVNYGLGYTRGYSTPAVGEPPPAHPQRYVSLIINHPPLSH